MRRISVLLCLLVLATTAYAAKKDKNRVVLDFATMYAVDEAFVGPTNAIRGIVGDELPWEIDGGVHGRLTSRGHLHLRVRGLVFTHDPEVPPELQGMNDETEFRAVVSCLNENDDASGGHDQPDDAPDSRRRRRATRTSTRTSRCRRSASRRSCS